MFIFSSISIIPSHPPYLLLSIAIYHYVITKNINIIIVTWTKAHLKAASVSTNLITFSITHPPNKSFPSPKPIDSNIPNQGTFHSHLDAIHSTKFPPPNPEGELPSDMARRIWAFVAVDTQPNLLLTPYKDNLITKREGPALALDAK